MDSFSIHIIRQVAGRESVKRFILYVASRAYCWLRISLNKPKNSYCHIFPAFPSTWRMLVKNRIYPITPVNHRKSLEKTTSFKEMDLQCIAKSESSEEFGVSKPRSLKNFQPVKIRLETSPSFKSYLQLEQNFSDSGKHGVEGAKSSPTVSLQHPGLIISPKPITELDAAAVKVQKVYKSYRTRRNLADCAVLVEELWWKALDFAALRRSSVSFFNGEKAETAVSRWARARTRAAKVGKGLSKDENAQKLALQHWLEAIDPRHRYGHNLHLYYDVWFESESCQPFFFWLDIGDGRGINLERCPRANLNRECIKYLGPKERETYEVVINGGKLQYKQSGVLIETSEQSKWIFVLSTLRILYVGEKKKGVFQHSSFLAGGAITAAGRLIAHAGVIKAVWPYSGHYHPTEQNFKEFISFLEEHYVDLTNVKRYGIDEENPSEPKEDSLLGAAVGAEQDRLACRWTTGAGPRIGCVRDYPVGLQAQALQHVNLSPRDLSGPAVSYGPIPSPRPSPKIRLSPRLCYMGLPSPRSCIPSTN